MTYLLSEFSKFYKTERNVQVADRVYPNVHTHIMKDFIDNDGRRKMVNYLETNDSSFVSYVENNKVVRSSERFNTPQKMKLGDKVYTGIVSRESFPGRYDIYSVLTSNCFYNDIRVRANGAALDINDLRRRVMIRKLKSPFMKLARLVTGK